MEERFDTIEREIGVIKAKLGMVWGYLLNKEWKILNPDIKIVTKPNNPVIPCKGLSFYEKLQEDLVQIYSIETRKIELQRIEA